ncbi:MAG: DUF4142 domain-containing protein [Hyphomicrobiales bacterium]|nr:DUF4142 domain-containing protein [Hyphomicrobiales bacterium]
MHRLCIALAAAIAVVALGVPAQARTLGIGVETEKQFIEKAAVGDLFEIQTSQEALKRSQNAAVKAHAQKMIEDHTKSAEKLKRIVETGNLPAAPAVLDSAHADMLEDLREAKAEDFDRTYIKMQQDSHEETLEMMERYAENGENPALKAFATEKIPTVQQHKSMVDGMRPTKTSAN